MRVVCSWYSPGVGMRLSDYLCKSVLITCNTMKMPAPNVLADNVLGTGIVQRHLVP